MKVVSVAGNRNAGKTSLVEALVAAVPEQSEVATIKSIHHDVEFDTPGTDTYRHREAGADVIIGITPSLTTTFRPNGKRDGVHLQDRLEALEAQGIDWAFVEGFKSTPMPTILVGDIDESAVQGEVLFRVTDGTAVEGATVFGRLETVPDWDPQSSSMNPE